MAIPTADQIRLTHILADDLQPRIDWAYDLERDIFTLSGGGLTSWGLASEAEFAGNGDPNGAVTATGQGDMYLDVTGRTLWLANGAGTVWTQVGAGGGGGAPTTADYLVGTANGGLSAEIVVGTSPGGELGGTWASPTVDSTHSGSTHASVRAAAEATAAAALSAHLTDATDAHDASAVSFVPGGTIAATDVQAAIAEVAAEAGLGTFPNAVGDGSPVGTIDPTAQDPGYSYLDETNGALYLVILNPDGPILEWVLVGGEIGAPIDVEGVILGNGQAFVGKSFNGTQAQITDVDAYNDSGNGIRWVGTGVDGEQGVEVRVGPVGFPIAAFLVFSDGTSEFARDVYFDRATHAAGAIGTSAGEPADGDINAGECFRFFDSTDGAARIGYKGKTDDGTVVFAYGPMGL